MSADLLSAPALPWILALIAVVLWLAGTWLDHHTGNRSATRSSTLAVTATPAAGTQTTRTPDTTTREYTFRLAFALTLTTDAHPA